MEKVSARRQDSIGNGLDCSYAGRSSHLSSSVLGKDFGPDVS